MTTVVKAKKSTSAVEEPDLVVKDELDAETATTTTSTAATTTTTSPAPTSTPTTAVTATVVETPQVVQPQQQIYIIQTTDGAIPMESAEVVVADDLAVYETVSALEQLSRGQVVATTTTGEGGELIQVYEEVVLPSAGDEAASGVVDQLVDVQEVEVGDGRSASPVKIEVAATTTPTGRKRKNQQAQQQPLFIPLSGNAEIAGQTTTIALTELHCPDCGKLFKSKRSLFGHKKEKHSGITEVHHCPECGKSFGRKSNLKAHRESLHYGKKFPCSYCERIFTNRSSMNQHIKKTHVVAGEDGATFTVVQQE